MSRLIDVYPYKKEQKRINLLTLKRSGGVKYPNQWRMVGGKVENEETFYEAAIRELKEETGFDPLIFWTIPSLNQFYNHNTDAINQIPAFGTEIESDTDIVLNHEHSEYKWISEEEIDDYILWPEQRRLMKLVVTIITKDNLLEEWIIKSRK